MLLEVELRICSMPTRSATRMAVLSSGLSTSYPQRLRQKVRASVTRGFKSSTSSHYWFVLEKEKVVALYNYESRSDGDLSFEKGDIMFLLDNKYTARGSMPVAKFILQKF